MNEDMRQEIKP